MSGFKQYIKKHMPPEWEYILKKEKVYTKFVDYVYKQQVKKGSADTKEIIYRKNCMFILRALSGSFILSIDFLRTKEGYQFWQDIQYKINKYKESCR